MSKPAMYNATVLSLLVCSTASAQWYDDAYGYRKLVTIDNTRVSTVNSTTLTDFPVLIHTTDTAWRSKANGGRVERTDGGDFVFTAADATTRLDHEIESFDPVTGQLIAWVRVPTLAGTVDTRVYVYYGNPSAGAPASGIGAWNSGYAGVWHLNDEIVEGELEMDSSYGDDPTALHVTGDVYAVAYMGVSNDGFVKTMTVTADGSVGSVIDTLEFDTSNGDEPQLIHVSGTMYAVAYMGSGDEGRVATFSIATDGSIGSLSDTYKFESNAVTDLSIVHVSGDIFAVAYNQTGQKGFVKTIDISSSGNIGSTQDTLEFADPGHSPKIVHVSGVWFAVVYKDGSNDGWIKTFDISSGGNIGSVKDSLEYEGSNGNDPQILHVSGDIFAIVYRGSDDDGWLVTVDIDSSGNIGSVRDSLEFDTSYAEEPNIVHVSGTTYAIGYEGPGNDGYVVTVSIAADGTIGDSTLGLLEFDTVETSDAFLVAVDSDTLVMAYQGPDSDLFVKTAAVSSSGAVSLATIVDSTSYARNGAPNGGMDSNDLVAGKVGNGLSFDGVNDYINVGNFLSGAATASYEAWVYKTDQDDVRVISKSDGTSASGTLHKFTLRLDSGATAKVSTRLNTVNNVGVDRQSQETFALNAWTHVALVYDGSAIKLYINGALATCTDGGNGGPGNSCTPTGALISSSRDVVIGNNDPGLNDRYFGGILDEVRASTTSRTSDWIVTSYNNQNDPASFYTLGAEQTGAPTLTVGPAGAGACGGSDCGYETIQAAVDAAANGETITLYRLDDVNSNGCYDEHITLNTANVTLQGAGTTESTVACIATTTGGDILTVTADGVTLKNLHVSGKANNGAGGTNSKGNGGRASGHGVLISGNDLRTTMVNVTVDFSYGDNVRFDGDQDADGVGRLQLKQCYLHHPDTGRNLRIIGGGGSASDQHLVRNCLIHTGQGILASGEIDYLTIERNIIKGWPYYDHLDAPGFNAFPKLRTAGFGGGWLFYSNCIAGVWVTSAAPTDLVVANNLIIGARHGIRVNTAGTIENNTVVNPFNCNQYDHNGTIDATVIRDNTYGIMIADGFSGTIRNNVVSVTDENRANGDPGQASGVYYTPGITAYGLAFSDNTGTLGAATIASNNVYGFVDTDGETALNYGDGISPDDTNLSVDPVFASDNESETVKSGGSCVADDDGTRCYEMYEDNYFESSTGGSCHAQIITNVAGASEFVDLSAGGVRDPDTDPVSGLGDCINTPDPKSSPILDFGTGDVGAETGKSGGAPNIGAFGGTQRASQSGSLQIVEVSTGFRNPFSKDTIDAVGVSQPQVKGLTSVNVRFNRAVIASSSSFSVRDYCDTANLAAPRVTTLFASQAPYLVILTWSGNTLVNTPVRIKVFGDGADRIVDTVDIEALDGEIADPLSSKLPSGDGTAGGDAEFVLFSLVGDVDGDGVVEGQPGGDDYEAITRSDYYNLNKLCFSCNEDLDGDFYVDSDDLAVVTSNDGNTATIPTCTGALDVRVADGLDDAEEDTGGNIDLSSSDLELVQESTAQTVGMRFTGMTIPPGATITNAYVQFQVDESSSGAVALTIRGQDADNAAAFSSSSGDISGRTTTSASVAWAPPDWNSVGAAGSDQRTGDLSAVIQEIVDRGGWSSGNAMVLIITGSGQRTAESYNGDSSAAALLHVEYTY